MDEEEMLAMAAEAEAAAASGRDSVALQHDDPFEHDDDAPVERERRPDQVG